MNIDDFPKEIIPDTKLPDKAEWIKFMNKAMRERTFSDITKGCVDIDHTKIEPYFIELLKKQGLNVKITRAWIHFMMPGSNHNAGHKHATDIGVYYLQAPKNSGNLQFNDLNTEIEPVEDLFVIVPALITHSMLENKSTEIRLAMGFPFVTVGVY